MTTSRGRPARNQGLIFNSASVQLLVALLIAFAGLLTALAPQGTLNLMAPPEASAQPAGIDTFGALRALCPNVAVLFSSGYSEDETMRRFSREEGVSFLQKPYTIATLMAAIDGLLVESPVHS